MVMQKKKKKDVASQNGERSDDGPQPEFNLRKYRMKDDRMIQRLRIRLAKAIEDNDEDGYDEATDSICEYMARFIVSVPAEWTVDEAPDNLDFNDIESFDWLAGGRFIDLAQAMNDAQSDRQKK